MKRLEGLEGVSETNEMQTELGPKTGLRKGLLIAGVATALFVSAISAQDGGKFDPSDIWFRAFTLLQDGMKAEEQGRMLDALSKFNESKPLFDGLAREFPEFHPQLVEYRRTQLVQKMEALRGRMRQGNQDAPANPSNQPMFGPNQPQPQGVPGGFVDVQPVSPEFAPPTDPGDGSVQLPQWQGNPGNGGANPNHPSSPAVIRPPADGSTVQSSPNYPFPAPELLQPPSQAGQVAQGDADDNPFMRIQRDFDRMRAEIDRLTKKNKTLEDDLAYRKSELFDAQNELNQS
ncbi:MAG: hypothetical protein KDL87_16180, partial [Verrucomicrobiae bacterium]|nr:hypothetical protein [Verrucomicrobiae bacterium]